MKTILTAYIINIFITLFPLHGYLSSKDTVQLNAWQERGFYYIYSLYFEQSYSYIQSWEITFFKTEEQEDLEEKESLPTPASHLTEGILRLDTVYLHL